MKVLGHKLLVKLNKKNSHKTKTNLQQYLRSQQTPRCPESDDY